MGGYLGIIERNKTVTMKKYVYISDTVYSGDILRFMSKLTNFCPSRTGYVVLMHRPYFVSNGAVKHWSSNNVIGAFKI